MIKIITGDIIESEKLDAEKKNSLFSELKSLSDQSASKYDFFIRGDSFQILSKGNALQETLILQALIHYKLNIKARISIGIGEADYLKEKLSDSDGEAFRLSGRGLDKIKEDDKLFGVFTYDASLDSEWSIYCDMLDYFFRKQTRNQSEAIYWLLNDLNQTEIAQQIGKSQSSVNARIKTTGWDIIKRINERFATL
jgi:uncharacterized protein YaaR (DUF327 family)